MVTTYLSLSDLGADTEQQAKNEYAPSKLDKLDKELARARHFLQLVRLPGKQFEGDGLAVHRACELPHGPDPDGKCIKTDFYFTDVDPDILHVFFAAVIA